MPLKTPALILSFLLLPLFSAFAQTDGSAPVRDTASPATTSESGATSSARATPTADGTGVAPADTVSVATSSSESESKAISAPSSVVRPDAVVPVTPPAVAPSDAPEPAPVESAPISPVFFMAVAVFAIIPLVYTLIKSVKKDAKATAEKEKGESRCFDIKKLLDEKLRELTDLRGMIESEVKDAARGAVREAVKGTKAGVALEAIEKAEKEYGRLKKLYEECMVEFGGKAFSGTIAETMLASKKILEKVRIEDTRHIENNAVHDVSVDEEHIAELSRHLSDGPWRVLLRKPGEDNAKVVFKDAVFDIKLSDTATWAPAIAHGVSVGISREQLDFKKE